MTVTFAITYTEAFLLEALRRDSRCQKKSHRTPAKMIALGLLLAVILAVAIQTRNAFPITLLIVLVGMLPAIQLLQNRQTSRAFQKSPYRNEQLLIHLSEDGFAAEGTVANQQMSWAAFTSARQFEDGFLLYQGQGVFNWLPASALTAGTVADAELLLRDHIADFERV